MALAFEDQLRRLIRHGHYPRALGFVRGYRADRVPDALRERTAACPRLSAELELAARVLLDQPHGFEDARSEKGRFLESLTRAFGPSVPDLILSTPAGEAALGEIVWGLLQEPLWASSKPDRRAARRILDQLQKELRPFFERLPGISITAADLALSRAGRAIPRDGLGPGPCRRCRGERTVEAEIAGSLFWSDADVPLRQMLQASGLEDEGRLAWFGLEGRTVRLPCPACMFPVGFPLPPRARKGWVLQGSAADGALRPLVRVESVEEVRSPARGSAARSGDQLVDFFPFPGLVAALMAASLASSVIAQYGRRR